jgi:anti-anti-sigma factor
MSIEQKTSGDKGIVVLSQEIDLDSSPMVRDAIKESFQNSKSVEVDLKDVSYIDSSGIAALVEGMQTGKKTNKDYALVNVSNQVLKVIKLAHLDKILKIASTSGADASGAQMQGSSEDTSSQSSDNIDMNPKTE